MVLELGPALDKPHPEQGNEPTLGVVHDHMVSVDLGAAGHYGLRTDSWVLEAYDIRIVGRLHFRITLSAAISLEATSALTHLSGCHTR